MLVTVKDMHNTEITLDVNPYDTIDAVKAKIRDMEGIPKYQQKLYYRGLFLQDEEALDYYSIRDGAELLFKVDFLRSDTELELMVRMEDRDVSVNLIGLRPTSTIDDVKTKIQDMMGTPKSMQSLFYKQIPLDDTFRLLDYNLRMADVITMKGRFGRCLCR